MKLERSISKNNATEKVLQFGTGVLLRGLCDYVVHETNLKHEFNGSVVVVKSTNGPIDAFEKQDNIYTHFIKGIKDGVSVEKVYVNESISRVLKAKEDWAKVLEVAASPDLEFIFSNTTEVGLSYVKETIGADAPESFPAKLTACLFHRFKAGLPGVVVIPTELINNNGKVLKRLVEKQRSANNLGDDFKSWLKAEVNFCSSLVDRIVPGKPKPSEVKKLGYEDPLAIISEPYLLWAIEGNAKIKEKLEYLELIEGVEVYRSIEKFKNLKLHLLNAPHTLMSGMAFLSGYPTVGSIMKDELMEKYMTILLLTELTLSVPGNLDAKLTQRFGRQVLDRFRNPFIEHKWIDITLNYTLKMKTRAVPLLLNYYDVFGSVPHYFTRCFAAYLLFMKPVKEENGVFYGENNGEVYKINCPSASVFRDAWKTNDPKIVCETILGNTNLWDEDLRTLTNFRNMVETHLSNMMMVGVKDIASALNVFA